MSRSSRGLTPRAARKKLLILEAELQRELLASDLKSFHEGVFFTAKRALARGAQAAITALLARRFSGVVPASKKPGRPTFLSRCLSVAKFAISVWLSARGRNPPR